LRIKVATSTIIDGSTLIFILNGRIYATLIISLPNLEIICEIRPFSNGGGSGSFFVGGAAGFVGGAAGFVGGAAGFVGGAVEEEDGCVLVELADLFCGS
jgi:hypothetical protein